MGLINVTKTEEKSASFENLLSDCLKSVLKESVDVPDAFGATTRMRKAMAMANRMVDIAIYSESEKNAISAARAIREFTEGKAAVQETKVKLEMPIVQFNLTAPQQETIMKKANLELPEYDDNKIEIDFCGEEIDGI